MVQPLALVSPKYSEARTLLSLTDLPIRFASLLKFRSSLRLHGALRLGDGVLVAVCEPSKPCALQRFSKRSLGRGLANHFTKLEEPEQPPRLPVPVRSCLNEAAPPTKFTYAGKTIWRRCIWYDVGILDLALGVEAAGSPFDTADRPISTCGPRSEQQHRSLNRTEHLLLTSGSSSLSIRGPNVLLSMSSPSSRPPPTVFNRTSTHRHRHRLSQARRPV